MKWIKCNCLVSKMLLSEFVSEFLTEGPTRLYASVIKSYCFKNTNTEGNEARNKPPS